MNALLTSRAEIEVFGKVYEKEDIHPVEFNEEHVSFRLKKTDFIYKLIKKSQIFAINVPHIYSEKQEDLFLMHEGMFEDKFKIANTVKLECESIDCPCIDKSKVYECSLLREEPAKDGIIVYGKVMKIVKT